MQKFEISDQALEEAAGAVVTSLLGTLPEPEELAHDFSDGFEEKMRLVIAKEKGFFAKHGMPDVEVAKQASWGATRGFPGGWCATWCAAR